MSIDELQELAFISKSMYPLECLEEALDKSYWIKFSTPDCDPMEIGGGEVDTIMAKHLRNAIAEIKEYIENIKIEGR